MSRTTQLGSHTMLLCKGGAYWQQLQRRMLTVSPGLGAAVTSSHYRPSQNRGRCQPPLKAWWQQQMLVSVWGRGEQDSLSKSCMPFTCSWPGSKPGRNAYLPEWWWEVWQEAVTSPVIVVETGEAAADLEARPGGTPGRAALTVLRGTQHKCCLWQWGSQEPQQS